MPKLNYCPLNDLEEAIGLSRTIATSFQFTCIGDDPTVLSQEDEHDHIFSMTILERHLEAIAQKMRGSK